MGNHEFCTDCHESNFHYGRPCDPVKKASVEWETQVRADRQKKQRARLAVICTFLKLNDIPARLEDGDDKIVIHGYDLSV